MIGSPLGNASIFLLKIETVTNTGQNGDRDLVRTSLFVPPTTEHAQVQWSTDYLARIHFGDN
jgi:hypothetical protein